MTVAGMMYHKYPRPLFSPTRAHAPLFIISTFIYFFSLYTIFIFLFLPSRFSSRAFCVIRRRGKRRRKGVSPKNQKKNKKVHRVVRINQPLVLRAVAGKIRKAPHERHDYKKVQRGRTNPIVVLRA